MTPDLKADLDALLTLLASRPMRVTTFGQPGAPRTVAVTERSVRDLVQGMLGGSRPIERLPFVVHAAANGDLKPIGQALSDDSGPPPPPRGVFLCILCSEAMPQVDPAAIDQATREARGRRPLRDRFGRTAAYEHPIELPQFRHL